MTYMRGVAEAFDRMAQEYEAQRVHVIPSLKEFYGAAVWVADTGRANPRILDLGAGTGLLSAMMLQRYPEAQMTLMDISGRMLDVARGRFGSCSNVHCILADYREAQLGGPFDIICSALSIHHLSAEEKRELFSKIFLALEEGGIFVNADQVRGETDFFERKYQEFWNAFLDAGPLNQEEREEIRRRRDELDRNERLITLLHWLQETGFRDVDLVYKNRTFAVIAARK